MIPVRVTATLLQGAIFNPADVPSLDGPLLYAATLERMGEGFYDRKPTNDELAHMTAEPDPGVPLAVHRAGGTWIYCVSSAEAVGHHGTTLTHWNKRVDDGALVAAVQNGSVDMGRQAKVPISSAQYKSYHMPIWTELVEAFVWHALTPDPDRLLALLQEYVTHVGKKRGSGNGVVSRWELETTGEADRWLYRADDSLARPVPLAMLPGWDGPTAPRTARPPYWLVQHATECAIS